MDQKKIPLMKRACGNSFKSQQVINKTLYQKPSGLKKRTIFSNLTNKKCNLAKIQQMDKKLSKREYIKSHRFMQTQQNETQIIELSKKQIFKQKQNIQDKKYNRHRLSTVGQNIDDEKNINNLYQLMRNKNIILPKKSQKSVTQSFRIINELIRCGTLSKNSYIQQLKCLACQSAINSSLIPSFLMCGSKQRLLKLSQQQIHPFKYDLLSNFLKNLSQQSYDSHETIQSFQLFASSYQYPIQIRLMVYYLGGYLFMLNCMYAKAEKMLERMLGEIVKYKLYQYVGVYLIAIVKLKANLLEWQTTNQYLTKLLAYAWTHKLKNLQIWTYFQLSRSYFFQNEIQSSQYFQNRSQMSICQPPSNQKQLLVRQFAYELEYMRNQHKHFNLDCQVAICELVKTPINYQKPKQCFKIQSQIKSINEHCKIKYVKNLIHRMNPNISLSHRGLINNQFSKHTSRSSSKFLAGNPMLRTHESGLKNINVYFRVNTKEKSSIGKNREPKMYTFQNSGKNILVLKQMCRLMLLQMNFYVPFLSNE